LRGVLEMSERRACTIVAADRKMIRYRSRRPPDTELRARLRGVHDEGTVFPMQSNDAAIPRRFDPKQASAFQSCRKNRVCFSS